MKNWGAVSFLCVPHPVRFLSCVYLKQHVHFFLSLPSFFPVYFISASSLKKTVFILGSVRINFKNQTLICFFVVEVLGLFKPHKKIW